MSSNKLHPRAKLGEQPTFAGTDDCIEITDKKKFIEELVNEDPAQSLIKRGYAVIKLDDETRNTYATFAKSLEAFCNQEIPEKAKFATLTDDSKFTPNQFHGYSRMEGLKEQYMIRSCGKGTNLLFPTSYNNSPHFGEMSLRLYRALDQTCRLALHQVCDALGLPHKLSDSIVDEVNDANPKIEIKNAKDGSFCNTTYMHEGYISSSLLDVFRYGNSFVKEDGSYDKFHNNHSSHTDSGILTVVPVADEPGLEVEDQIMKAWIPLEKMIHETVDDHRKYGTIFWGDSFMYLAKDKLQPCLHRVAKSDKERYSIVFKMRTKPTVTAPRYQEDYDLAVMQTRSLQKIANKKLFNATVAIGYVSMLAIIGYKIIQTRSEGAGFLFPSP